MPLEITYQKTSEKSAVSFKPDENKVKRSTFSFGSSWSASKKASFYNEVRLLLVAGLDLHSTLSLLVETSKDKIRKEVVEKLLSALTKGSSLSDVMETIPYFTPYEIHAIRIGEETGQLNAIVEELARFYLSSAKLSKQIRGALAYPSFVISFAFLVLWFLLRYLVPMFSQMFQRFNGELPAITQKIIQISEFTWEYGWLVGLSIVSVVAFVFVQRQADWFKKWSALIFLKIPVIKDFVKTIYLNRFFLAMHMVLRSNVPLLESIRLAKEMTDFYPLKKSLTTVETEILLGTPFHKALEKTNFFKKSEVALLKVGEEAGCLDELFGNLSSQYQDDFEQKTSMLNSLLEPVLIVIIGMLVGTILIAIYLPIFQMSVAGH